VCGLALEPAALSVEPSAEDPELRSMTRRLFLALALTVPLVGLVAVDRFVEGAPITTAIGENAFLTLQALLCTPIVFLAGQPFLVRAWWSARALRPNLFTLIGLGVAAAYTYSLVALVYLWSGTQPLPAEAADANLQPVVVGSLEVFAPYRGGRIVPFFETAAVIVVFVLLGQVLELRARSRAGAAIRKLIRLAPTTAHAVGPDGTEEDRPVGEVRPGDLVRVGPGERIPVDGVIRDGSTAIDESMFTGEATRVGRGPGAAVMAGTENGLGPITVEVTRVGRDTVLSQVVELVGRARRTRVKLQRTVDRVAWWLVPAVLLIAAGTYAGWAVWGPPGSAMTVAAVCAVGVLIAACPVAVGLATPTAVVAGMSRASQFGVLFRDAAALERLAAIDTVLLDKTGTLTEGRMQFSRIEANPGMREEQVLALAAAVERGSEHPIGLAIVWEAARQNLTIPAAEGVESVAGRGIRGTVDGHQVVVGRIGFLQEHGVHFNLMVSEARTHRLYGHVVVFIGYDDRCIGIVVMEDPVRPTSRAGVDQLWASKLKVMLVTGDHVDTARSVGKVLGIEDVVGDALPAEKYAVVQKLKNEGRVVAMVGDGVNDAPALAAADVGIAVSSGADVAVTTAGMTLVRPDVRAVAAARDLSKATVRTIRQNLGVAFAYNALAVPIAAGALVPLGGGLLSPVWAAVATSLSSLSVVLNSWRLYRLKR
jgi:Cu+-exporting ATPase